MAHKGRTDGNAVSEWPEFQAFADRLGIDRTVPWTELNINLRTNAQAEIKQTYLGVDSQAENSHYYGAAQE